MVYVLDVLDNDTYLDALLGLSLKQPVKAILGHAGPAQVELCSRSVQQTKIVQLG